MITEVIYTVDNLTRDSVSVKTQEYYNNMPLGEPHRKAYTNDLNGRAELREDVPAEQYNAVIAVWGN